MKRAALGVLALAVLFASPPAAPFKLGGHHYTLNGILHQSKSLSLGAAALTPRDQQLVAFCAFLPDLSTDLDAVILRERVVLSKGDWRWAIAEQCATNTSRQMVVTQFYLHALSGWDVQPFRFAAHKLARNIMATIPTAGADRDARLCELGFSMHLLGDTFAHSRLSKAKQTKLYDTGLGHFSDGEAPDFMLRRNFPEYDNVNNRWGDWVTFVGQALGAQNGATIVQNSGIGVATTFSDLNGLKVATGESAMNLKLISLDAGWRITDDWKKGSLRRPWSGPRCNDQIRELAGLPQSPFAGLQIDCNHVWSHYLRDAEAVFGAIQPAIQPKTSSCRIRRNATDTTLPTLE